MDVAGRPTDPASGAPTEASVAKRLEAFVPQIAEGRRDELGELIAALRSPGLQRAQQWAHIDLVTAFDPPSAIHGRKGAGNIWRGVATFGVFLPLMLTWIGLHEAISAFERMPAAARIGSFFEQWIRGFDSEYAGFLGPLNSLSALAIVTAVLFAVLVIAGGLTDSSVSRVEDSRIAFRGALTDAMRLLDVRFPESPAAAAAAVRELTEQLKAAQASAATTQRALENSQAQVLRTTSDAVVGMTTALQAQFDAAVGELKVVSGTYQDNLSQVYAAALDAQLALVESLQTGLAQSTAAMVSSGQLVAAMTNHTRDELSRTADYDRILTHVADSALRLGQIADRLDASASARRI